MSKNKKIVLHIEDDPSLQNLVRIVLEQTGDYDVRSAGSGTLALEMAPAIKPALLLLDQDLPGINGMLTLRAMRLIPGVEGVPVVFLTAAVDSVTEAELRALGVREVLRKPFRPRVLIEVIGRVLADNERT